MADEKVVVGWAIKGYGDWWLRDSSEGKWDSKTKRKIFPSRDEAFKRFRISDIDKLCSETAVVRITRKVKPKQYFVQMGPFSPYVAGLCVEQLSQNLSSHFLPKIVEKDLSK